MGTSIQFFKSSSSSVGSYLRQPALPYDQSKDILLTYVVDRSYASPADFGLFGTHAYDDRSDYEELHRGPVALAQELSDNMVFGWADKVYVVSKSFKKSSAINRLVPDLLKSPSFYAHDIGALAGKQKGGGATEYRLDNSADWRAPQEVIDFLRSIGMDRVAYEDSLGIAYEVLRAHNIREWSDQPELIEMDGATLCLVRFGVAATPEQLGELNFELCGKLAENESLPENFHIVFEAA